VVEVVEVTEVDRLAKVVLIGREFVDGWQCSVEV
jgi:hypothetical protein